MIGRERDGKGGDGCDGEVKKDEADELFCGRGARLEGWWGARFGRWEGRCMVLAR